MISLETTSVFLGRKNTIISWEIKLWKYYVKNNVNFMTQNFLLVQNVPLLKLRNYKKFSLPCWYTTDDTNFWLDSKLAANVHKHRRELFLISCSVIRECLHTVEDKKKALFNALGQRECAKLSSKTTYWLRLEVYHFIQGLNSSPPQVIFIKNNKIKLYEAWSQSHGLCLCLSKSF